MRAKSVMLHCGQLSAMIAAQSPRGSPRRLSGKEPRATGRRPSPAEIGSHTPARFERSKSETPRPVISRNISARFWNVGFTASTRRPHTAEEEVGDYRSHVRQSILAAAEDPICAHLVEHPEETLGYHFFRQVAA